MTTQASYDSRLDTLAHIDRVRELLAGCVRKLERRAEVHDASKLQEPEKSVFDACTSKLKALTYGSEEYKAALAELKPALDHHYANNSHHPEFYGYLECNICFTRYPRTYQDQCSACGNGQFTDRPNVDGMSLLDLVEMLMDWKAAGERLADGDIMRSIEINTKRFGLTPQLVAILQNTVKECGWTAKKA